MKVFSFVTSMLSV